MYVSTYPCSSYTAWVSGCYSTSSVKSTHVLACTQHTWSGVTFLPIHSWRPANLHSMAVCVSWSPSSGCDVCDPCPNCVDLVSALQNPHEVPKVTVHTALALFGVLLAPAQCVRSTSVVWSSSGRVVSCSVITDCVHSLSGHVEPVFVWSLAIIMPHCVCVLM